MSIEKAMQTIFDAELAEEMSRKDGNIEVKVQIIKYRVNGWKWGVYLEMLKDGEISHSMHVSPQANCNDTWQVGYASKQGAELAAGRELRYRFNRMLQTREAEEKEKEIRTKLTKAGITDYKQDDGHVCVNPDELIKLVDYKLKKKA